MTGFRGQKFDFTGEDGAWYAVLDDGSALRINMRGEIPELCVVDVLPSARGLASCITRPARRASNRISD